MRLPNLSLAALPEDWQQGGFGLYIHWPYCKAKCPYCDFNSHVAANIDQNRWNRAYISEIQRIGAETKGRVLNSVFFGGGTPSLMNPDVVASIMETVRKTWQTSNSFEVTLEANPTSVEADRFRGFRDAGINRVSMGIQALNDPDLKALGRLHTVTEAQRAFDLARNTFERVSFDLIYARQNQSLGQWRAELIEALNMAADHLSLYQLTIEPGTAFGDRHAVGKLKGLPGEDISADMYFATQEICESAGLPAYEISNHAAEGSESRHNLIYWNGGDYAGIGPGAHGRLTLGGKRLATDTPLTPNTWLDWTETKGSGENQRVEITPADQAGEYLMMGLRLNSGISIERIRNMDHNSVNTHKINELRELGMVKLEGGSLFATQTGRPVLNAIIRELLTSPT